MKKSTKIVLSVSFALLAGFLAFGYVIYQKVAGSEAIAGKKDAIPSASKDICPVSSGTSDWPNWRGGAFDGKSAFTGIKTDWSFGLKKRWQIDYLCQGDSSATWSSPVIQGNRLVVMGRDGGMDVVFCIHTETGRLIWKGSYPAVTSSAHGEGARATPFIDNGLVYTYGRSGDLFCWDLFDGKQIWKQNVRDAGGLEPDWGFSATPLVTGSRVIVQGGGSALVVAYDKLSGKLLWKSMQGDPGYAAIIPVTVDAETELLVYHGKGLALVGLADGKEYWNAPWATSYGVNAATPVVDRDIVFHTSGYGMGGEALRFTRNGFEVLWKNKAIAAQHTDPILIDGYLYGYSGDSSRRKGQFKCVELATGKEMWSSEEIGQGSATCVDGYLICLDITGNVYLVKPDPKSFVLSGTFRNAMEDVKSPSWTVPVVANGNLYLRYLQRLVCYSLN